MNEVQRRLQAIKALSGLRGKSISLTGRSVGSVINIGIGKTRILYRRRRSGRRKDRYVRRAETDFLLWTTAWTLYSNGRAHLDGTRSSDRHIGREVEKLIGKRIIGVKWREPLLRFTLDFGRGNFLQVHLKKQDVFDGNDWSMQTNFTYLRIGNSDGRNLVSVK
jgi:hypothetical protein